jgi:prepilin-type N-terminal cleavage/methylation domain-containing protein
MRGFTLIEVLMATAVMAVALVCVIQAMSSVAGALASAQDELDVSFLSKEHIAQLKIKALTGAKIGPGKSSGAYQQPAYSRFSWVEEVSEAPAAQPGLYSLRLVNLWARRGNAKSRAIFTYISAPSQKQ